MSKHSALTLRLVASIFFLCAACHAQASAPANKQRRAEIAADRMMKRFYETLQFKTIWDEFYVTNRKLVVVGNVGSQSYISRARKFPETNPADIQRMREVFAEAGLSRNTPIYVVHREMFHIYMIEENGELRVLTILLRERG